MGWDSEILSHWNNNLSKKRFNEKKYELEEI